MKIGGLQKISLIDYPGRISAIVFTQGCNFRCPYCHNPELVDPAQYGPILPEEEVISFLEKRRGKLDAVTVTGGEPTLQPDLERFLQEIKEMGYLTKIDTNGSNPDYAGEVDPRTIWSTIWPWTSRVPSRNMNKLQMSRLIPQRSGEASNSLPLRELSMNSGQPSSVLSLIREDLIATAKLLKKADCMFCRPLFRRKAWTVNF